MSGDLVGLVVDRPHLPTDRVIWVRLLEAATVSVESWLTVSGELGPWLGQVAELRRRIACGEPFSHLLVAPEEIPIAEPAD